MNKRITRKVLTALAVAAMFTGGAMAQGIPNSDYTQYDDGAAAPNDIEYVTAGSTLGYYADPDPIYHPNYATTSAITASFVWNWTAPTDPGTAATVDYPVATFPANYVQITYPVAGNYVLNVAEEAPASFGGCVDASPTIMNVTAVAAPTATASIGPGGSWQEISAGVAYQICGDQAAQTVTLAFVEDVPDGLASYAFQITETIENLNGADVVTSTPQAETVIEDWSLASKLTAANLDGNTDATTLASAAFSTATPNFDFTFASDALTIQNSTRTRYTYTFTRTGDTGNNDFASNISHKSNYLGATSYYGFTNNSVTFTVNPTPVTGPIYNVSNTFRY